MLQGKGKNIIFDPLPVLKNSQDELFFCQTGLGAGEERVVGGDVGRAVQAWIIGSERSVWLGQKRGLSSKDCSRATSPPSAAERPARQILTPTS